MLYCTLKLGSLTHRDLSLPFSHYSPCFFLTWPLSPSHALPSCLSSSIHSSIRLQQLRHPHSSWMTPVNSHLWVFESAYNCSTLSSLLGHPPPPATTTRTPVSPGVTSSSILFSIALYKLQFPVSFFFVLILLLYFYISWSSGSLPKPSHSIQDKDAYVCYKCMHGPISPGNRSFVGLRDFCGFIYYSSLRN